MYLYFDSKGVLKEIINDNALRQGATGNDNIYVYVEGITAANISNYKAWIRFARDAGEYVSDEMEVAHAPVVADDAIPFDPKRDLRFFKYYQDYPFFVIPFSQDLTLDEEGLDPDAYDYDMLEEAGNVALTIRLVTGGDTIKVLGLVVFNVEYSAESLSNTVQVEHYLSLSQFNYLVALMNEYENDLSTKLDIDDNEKSLPAAYVSSIYGTQELIDISEEPYAYAIPLYQGNGRLQSNAPALDLDVANKKYVDDAIDDAAPTFTTTTGTISIDGDRYLTITGLGSLAHFRQNQFLIFTYGGCFVIIPVKDLSLDTNYYVSGSALWNEDEEHTGIIGTRVYQYQLIRTGSPQTVALKIRIYQSDISLPEGYGYALIRVKL